MFSEHLSKGLFLTVESVIYYGDSLKILYYVFIFYSLAKRLAIPSSHFATQPQGIFGISAAPFFLLLYLFYFFL